MKDSIAQSIEGIRKLIVRKRDMIRQCRRWLRHGGSQFVSYRSCLDTAARCIQQEQKLKIIKSELEKLI